MANRTGTSRGWLRWAAAGLLLAPLVVAGLTDARAVMLAVVAAVVGAWVGWEWRRRGDRRATTRAATVAPWPDDTSSTTSRPPAWGGAVNGALRTAVTVLAAGGAFVLAGPVAWPLLGAAVVAVTAWAVWFGPRRRHPSRSRTPSPVLPKELRELDTVALCQEWQFSALSLASARDAESLAAAVDLRSAYLDEMERRHPDGFRRWVDSGARVGDPARYLVAD